MRPSTAGVAACAAALVLAACGGDDKKESSTTTGGQPALSAAETGRAVNALCLVTELPAKAVAAKLNGDPAHDSPLLAGLVDDYRRVLERLHAIVPDTALKANFDQFVALAEDQVTLLQELSDKAKSGDAAAYQAATNQVVKEGVVQQAARKKAAVALGAPDCAKS